MRNKKVLLVILLGGVILLLPMTGTAKKKASGNSTVYFKSCKEARAAGYSDIKKGEPGYSSNLDRDGDGIACDKKK